MGKGKVHSGAGEFKEVRADDKFVCNREVIVLPRLCTDHGLLHGKTAAVATGIAVSGPDSTITTPVYQFTDGEDRAVQFHTTVPSGLPADAQLVVRPYWTCMSGANTVLAASGVVWDVDYMIVPVSYSSGTINQPRTRFFSGTVSNATGTGYYQPQAEFYSGVVCGGAVTIPSSKILPDAHVNCVLFRDVGETADDLMQPAYLLCVVLEYTKA